MKNSKTSVNILIMLQANLPQDIKIIFENDDFLAINKPAGLLVHATPGKKLGEITLVDWLKLKYPAIEEVGEDPLRPGIVHRLDRDTSGVMLIAKNNQTFFYLKELFQKKKIKKGYLALVQRTFKNKKGMIDMPIGRISSSSKHSVFAKKMKDLKEAQTDYEVLKNFSSETGSGFAFLQIYPRTGRTNQIRVHLASIHHPVLGDKIYGSKKTKLPPGLDRMFLHAYFLELPLKEGRVMRLEADLPDDLKLVLTGLGFDK